MPGDIIEITNNMYVPCDCILLAGECIIDESSLTGSWFFKILILYNFLIKQK